MARKTLVYETAGLAGEKLRSIHLHMLGKPGCHIVRDLRAEVLDEAGMAEAAETVRNLEA